MDLLIPIVLFNKIMLSMDTNHTHEAHHVVPYKTYGIILAILLLLTAISVAVTQIELDSLTVTVAIVLATIKSALVLYYFMHLKFDDIILHIMVIAVIAVLALVILITLLDYIYR